MIPHTTLDVSGDRFTVIYRIAGSREDAVARAQHICIEQTVEFPARYVHDDDIRKHVFGRVESQIVAVEDSWEARISYAVEVTGFQLPQLLNVIFGNISLVPGVRVRSLEIPESLARHFRGPRFGRTGLRKLFNAPKGPLYCSALKPMGLPAGELAEQAYQFALGGIHIIKDDHGLGNQPFAPFRERVPLCVQAVERANRETGGSARYAPSINSCGEQFFEDARWAKAEGAGALLVAPGLVGWDIMRAIADDDSVGRPILCHPAFVGAMSSSVTSGFSHGALYGQLVRLAGGDVSIYPNFGGRFSFTIEQCREIAAACRAPMSGIKTIFPAPGGGMDFDNVPEMAEAYGDEVMYLIGGALHQGGATVAENSRRLRAIAERGRLE